MAYLNNGNEQPDEDFLLALKLSEGVNQFDLGGRSEDNLDEDFRLALKLSEEPYPYSLGGCSEDKLDEDFLLALKLSNEPYQHGVGGSSGQSELSEDFLLALELSERDNRQLESDAAFAQRLEREINGGGSPDEPEDELSTVSADTSEHVTILREWYAGSQGQVSKLADLFQHLSSLDDIMLRERSGLCLTAVARQGFIWNRYQTNNNSSRASRPRFGKRVFSTSSNSGQVQQTKTPDLEGDQKISAAFDYVCTNLNDFTGDIEIGKGRRVPVGTIVAAMLDLSLFLETIEMLLRGDSIKHLAERLDLVKSLLGLLKAMSLLDEYQSILMRPRRLKRRTKGLQGIAQSPPGTLVTSVIILENENEPKSQPLIDLLVRLKVQAEVYLKGARSSNDGEFRVGEGAASMSMCEYLVKMHGSILGTTVGGDSVDDLGKGNRANPKLFRSSKTVVPPQNEFLSKPPQALDWSVAVLNTHYFKSEAEQIVKPFPGRQQKLVRQVTELTNLPEGIFVRVMNPRPDVLKALIVGPKDTPYEGGLFEFDVLAPGDFPNNPPKIIFRTTAGGRVRFNPNLYSDRKVCLSLINTWAGGVTERWVPGSSTLLQCFVSIQSIIFVECPYTNEPGREGLGGQLASEQHKEFVRANTIRWGMIDWLQDNSKRNGMWKDVVQAHFLGRASQLQRLIRDSAVGNVGIRHYHGNHTEDTLVRKPDGGMDLEKELNKCLSSLDG